MCKEPTDVNINHNMMSLKSHQKEISSVTFNSIKTIKITMKIIFTFLKFSIFPKA